MLLGGFRREQINFGFEQKKWSQGYGELKILHWKRKMPKNF